MNQLQILHNLKSLKEEWQNDKSLNEEEVKLRIGMVNPFIRGHEILLRLNEYEDGGFYFGYLLIQSQRIESSIKSLLVALYRYKAKTESKNEILLESKLDIPLGAFITELKKYILSEVLFGELEKFKDFRNKIVHKINDDLSLNLSEIENSIFLEYHPDSIAQLQTLIFKVFKVLDSKTFGFKVLDDFIKEYNIEKVDIKIL